MTSKKLFKLSAICVSVLSAWQTANAADIKHTCESATYCGYSKLTTSISTDNSFNSANYWIFSAKDIPYGSETRDEYINLGSTKDNLIATLKPQHYQNEPATETGDGSSDYQTIIRISGQEHENKAMLTIPTGTTATLRESRSNSEIIHIWNATGKIEKGVTLTIDPSYEELNSIENTGRGSIGISIDGSLSNVTTAADIVVNSKDAEAIAVGSGAKLFANDHKMTLNSSGVEGITVSSGAQAVVNNVTVAGNGSEQFAFTIDDKTSLLQITNSRVALSNENNTGVLGFANGKIEVTNSTLEADIGILADAYGYDNLSNAREPSGNQNVLNITNSTLKGRETLLEVNPDTDGSDTITALTAHSTTINAENSQLYGKIITLGKDDKLVENVPENFNNKVFLTLKNSEWALNGNSQIDDTLAVLDSNVTFEKSANGFNTLTLNDLIGSATFTMNTDLANQKSDQIIINGLAEGDHQLAIKDSGNEPNAANGKVTLVKTVGNGEAKFSLKDRQFVDAGAYRYRLNQEGNDWVLSNRQAEKAQATQPVTPTTPTETAKPVVPTTPTETAKPVVPTTPTETAKPVVPTTPTETAKPVVPITPTDTVKPIVPTTPSVPAQVVLSEKSNALVSLRQAQLVQMEQSLAGIHQRLGELKQAEKGNVWVRNLNSRSEFDATRTADNSQSSGFDQKFHGVQIGADAAVSDNWRVGGFVGAERATVDFKGEYGSGKLSGQSFGLYAAYQADNGFYVDNIAKFSRLKAESSATGERRYNAYTLSSEVGKIYTLGNQWSVTPNAQLAWSSIAGKDDEDRLSAVYARFGARLAKMVDVGGWKLQPYAEVNSVTSQNKNSHVRVNQYRFEVESSRGRVETALGVNAATGNHRFGVEAKTAYGKRLDQPFLVQANYRYSW